MAVIASSSFKGCSGYLNVKLIIKLLCFENKAAQTEQHDALSSYYDPSFPSVFFNRSFKKKNLISEIKKSDLTVEIFVSCSQTDLAPQ